MIWRHGSNPVLQSRARPRTKSIGSVCRGQRGLSTFLDSLGVCLIFLDWRNEPARGGWTRKHWLENTQRRICCLLAPFSAVLKGHPQVIHATQSPDLRALARSGRCRKGRSWGCTDVVFTCSPASVRQQQDIATLQDRCSHAADPADLPETARNQAGGCYCVASRTGLKGIDVLTWEYLKRRHELVTTWIAAQTCKVNQNTHSQGLSPPDRAG